MQFLRGIASGISGGFPWKISDGIFDETWLVFGGTFEGILGKNLQKKSEMLSNYFKSVLAQGGPKILSKKTKLLKEFILEETYEQIYGRTLKWTIGGTLEKT